MKLNPLLEEKPGHGHYSACLERKEEIDKYCNKAFAFTVLSSVLMAMFTIGTVTFPLLSFIPGLFGNSWDVVPIFVQITELIGLCFIGALACTRRKLFLVILMIWYILLAASSLIKGTLPGCAVSLLVGIFGTVYTAKAPSVYRDYNQLRETEGWPHFAIWLAEAEEKPAYSYDDYRKRLADKAAREAAYRPEAARSAPSPRYEDKPGYDTSPTMSAEARRMAADVMREAELAARSAEKAERTDAARLAAEEAAREREELRRAEMEARGIAPPVMERYASAGGEMPGIAEAADMIGEPERALPSGDYGNGFTPM